MGISRMGPPEELIYQLQSRFRIPNFIETGTYRGNTAYWASRHFSHVYSIEFAQDLYEEAVRKYSSSANITFLLGDSRTKLKKIISDLREPAVFWLDAHWSGGATFGEHEQCPILQEISALNASSHSNVILIDDARLFLSPPQPPHNIEQWPDITTVLSSLQSTKKNRYAVIIEDVIVAVPFEMKPVVASYCQKVNAALWEAYARDARTSDLEKGLSLIGRHIDRRLRNTISPAIRLCRALHRTIRKSQDT
jgi:hypothetical protein